MTKGELAAHDLWVDLPVLKIKEQNPPPTFNFQPTGMLIWWVEVSTWTHHSLWRG